METDTGNPLNFRGSTDTDDATCPTCREPITEIETRGPGDHRAQCGHRLFGTLAALRLGGGQHV